MKKRDLKSEAGSEIVRKVGFYDKAPGSLQYLRPGVGLLFWITLGLSTRCLALDQASLTSEFSLPNLPRNSVDTQDAYFDAVQGLQLADAALVRAREGAVKEAQSTPEYGAAVKAVDAAFQAFIEKKNALVTELEKNDPHYSQMKAQAVAIDAKIDAAVQSPDTRPEQLEEFYKDRDNFKKQWQQAEGDAMDREKITPLKQTWIDATKKLAELQDKQRAAVDAAPIVQGALKRIDEEKAKVDLARAAIQHGPATPEMISNERTGAGDFLRRYAQNGFAGNDAWWTYGWTTIRSGAKAPTGK